ncbi:hypothetical protein D1Z90_20875, partial [Motilimonas pumila]
GFFVYVQADKKGARVIHVDLLYLLWRLPNSVALAELTHDKRRRSTLCTGNHYVYASIEY